MASGVPRAVNADTEQNKSPGKSRPPAMAAPHSHCLGAMTPERASAGRCGGVHAADRRRNILRKIPHELFRPRAGEFSDSCGAEIHEPWTCAGAAAHYAGISGQYANSNIIYNQLLKGTDRELTRILSLAAGAPRAVRRRARWRLACVAVSLNDPPYRERAHIVARYNTNVQGR